jgi:hypothetical protein
METALFSVFGSVPQVWTMSALAVHCGHLHTRVYIKRKSQSCFLEIYGLFSKLPIMYKGKLWKGLTYIV